MQQQRHRHKTRGDARQHTMHNDHRISYAPACNSNKHSDPIVSLAAQTAWLTTPCRGVRARRRDAEQHAPSRSPSTGWRRGGSGTYGRRGSQLRGGAARAPRGGAAWLDAEAAAPAASATVLPVDEEVREERPPKRTPTTKGRPAKARKAPPFSDDFKAQLERELAVEARLREKINRHRGIDQPDVEELLGGYDV